MNSFLSRFAPLILSTEPMPWRAEGYKVHYLNSFNIDMQAAALEIAWQRGLTNGRIAIDRDLRAALAGTSVESVENSPASLGRFLNAYLASASAGRGAGLDFSLACSQASTAGVMDARTTRMTTFSTWFSTRKSAPNIGCNSGLRTAGIT
jgi:hypothetical protein